MTPRGVKMDETRFGSVGKRLLAGLALAAGLTACESDFSPASRVTDFRLIAVQADAPYAAPGQTVKLSTLSHEPFGRKVTWGWSTCVLPKSATAPGCMDKIAEDAKTSGKPPAFEVGENRTTYETTIPADVLANLSREGRTGALVGVLTVGCPGALSLADPASVPPGGLPFHCVEDGTGKELPYDRWVVSLKRVYVRETDRNQNPPIGDVLFDGATWGETEVKEVTPCDGDDNAFDDCSGGEHEVTLRVASGAVESGTDESGSSFTERVVVQYYATEGTFEFDVRTAESPKTRWKARKQDVGRTLTMWFVARDNRGGVSWTSRSVKVK